MNKLQSKSISLPRIIGFTSSLVHLFNGILAISSPTSRTYTVRSSLVVFLSISPRSIPLSFVQACSFTWDSIIMSRNIRKTTKRSHHQIIIFSSFLHMVIYACYDLTLPGQLFPAFVIFSFPVIIRTSAWQQQFQPEMIRTVTCHGSYINLAEFLP